jgi:hypothetical protein
MQQEMVQFLAPTKTGSVRIQAIFNYKDKQIYIIKGLARFLSKSILLL